MVGFQNGIEPTWKQTSITAKTKLQKAYTRSLRQKPVHIGNSEKQIGKNTIKKTFQKRNHRKQKWISLARCLDHVQFFCSVFNNSRDLFSQAALKNYCQKVFKIQNEQSSSPVFLLPFVLTHSLTHRSEYVKYVSEKVQRHGTIHERHYSHTKYSLKQQWEYNGSAAHNI